MHLDLTDDEARALSDCINARLGVLSTEIRRTDKKAYREDVRAERDTLRRVAAALAAEMAARRPLGTAG